MKPSFARFFKLDAVPDATEWSVHLSGDFLHRFRSTSFKKTPQSTEKSPDCQKTGRGD